MVVAAIKGGASELQTWGFIDNNEPNWRNGESAFPYANNFEQKPAWFGIKEALIDMSSILFWEMDAPVENIMPDVMKYNNFGTMNNFGTPVLVSGYKKNALQFDGVDDYISTGNLSDTIPGDFTLSFFLKTETSKASAIAVLVGTNYGGFEVGIDVDGKVFFEGAEINAGGNLMSSIPVNDGIWHFVAIQRDSIKYSLYVDDSAPVSTGHGPLIDLNKLVVGAKIDGSEPFEGVIDEVKLFNSAIEEGSFTRNYGGQDQPTLRYKYSSMRVRLDWTDVINEKVGYIVDRKISNGNWEKAGEVAENVLYFIESLGVYSAEYSYRVRSSSKFANSGTSNVVTVVTPNDPSTGISVNTEEKLIDVFPNPVHDKFTLITSDNLWVKIFDINGKLMLEKKKCAASQIIDIGDFQNGIYFLQSCNNEKISVVKLIKE